MQVARHRPTMQFRSQNQEVKPKASPISRLFLVAWDILALLVWTPIVAVLFLAPAFFLVSAEYTAIYLLFAIPLLLFIVLADVRRIYKKLK